MRHANSLKEPSLLSAQIMYMYNQGSLLTIKLRTLLITAQAGHVSLQETYRVDEVTPPCVLITGITPPPHDGTC